MFYDSKRNMLTQLQRYSLLSCRQVLVMNWAAHMCGKIH